MTAEEAFAKACFSPEIFISDSEAVSWATRHGVLEGASLTGVLQAMQNDGFRQDGFLDNDGPYASVDWTNAGTLKSAIWSGPVKLAIAADQIGDSWGRNNGRTGWIAVGYRMDNNFDHSVSLCGYGTFSWLSQQLGAPLPAGTDGNRQGYAMFTWNSIGIIDHDSLVNITCEAWLRQPTTLRVKDIWEPQKIAGPFGTSFRPSLAYFNNNLFAAWKGIPGDQGIWWSKFDGNAWGPQQNIPGVGTSIGPSLATFNNRLYAAWKGIEGDQGIWWSSFDGSTWAAQRNISGVGSNIGPSLAAFQNRLFAAWKGIQGDQGIYWSSFDGNAWAPQQRIQGVGSSNGPSLAVYQNRLYAVWKGIDGDQGLWWSSFDGNSWAPQKNIPGVGSSVGPSITVCGDKLYASWKGITNDQGIWWSSFNGQFWAPQQRISNVGTSAGPSLAGSGNTLIAMWKGISGDNRLWWSRTDASVDV